MQIVAQPLPLVPESRSSFVLRVLQRNPSAVPLAVPRGKLKIKAAVAAITSPGHGREPAIPEYLIRAVALKVVSTSLMHLLEQFQKGWVYSV